MLIFGEPHENTPNHTHHLIHISCITCVSGNLEEILQREIEEARRIATKEEY